MSSFAERRSGESRLSEHILHEASAKRTNGRYDLQNQVDNYLDSLRKHIKRFASRPASSQLFLAYRVRFGG